MIYLQNFSVLLNCRNDQQTKYFDICVSPLGGEVGFKWSKFQHNYRRTVFHNCLSCISSRKQSPGKFTISIWDANFRALNYLIYRFRFMLSPLTPPANVHNWLALCRGNNSFVWLQQLEWKKAVKSCRVAFMSFQVCARGALVLCSIQSDSCWGHFKWH